MKNTQYYEHTCLCGCGDKIEIKSHHEYYGIPEYINGHNKTGGGFKHGEEGTRLYVIWAGMKQRCSNINVKDFIYYGGRGITVCDEWLEFIPFRDWSLSNGYIDNLTIDRKDSNKGYEPSNCQWITMKENSRKQRTNTLTIKLANEIRELDKTGLYTQKQLAEKYCVSEMTISLILRNKRWKNY